jgi:guanosine-3',5'-bis(diphosphate) 3'-pyrophosphohydrolase
MNNVVLVSRAADFAAQRHADQRRKGPSKQPYINHLSDVARRLAMATDGSDAPLVAAGWLHDTIEDTSTSRNDLALEFGEDVASLVVEVTDDKTLPKAERKRLQVVQTPKKSRRARMIKIADLTSNLRSLPDDWERERVVEYFDWADKVMNGCRGINSELERNYDEVASSGRATL